MSDLLIHLRQPAYRPGDEVAGEVELRLDEPVTARGVRLRVEGDEHTHLMRGSEYGETFTERTPILQEEIVFAGEERLETFAGGLADVWNTLLNRVQHTEIPAGEHHYPFAFRLPQDAPPSYDGSSAEIEYRLLAYVDVPLWIDLRQSAGFRVLPLPVARVAGESPPSEARYPPAQNSGFWEEVGEALRHKVRAVLSLPRSEYLVGEWIGGIFRVEDTGGARIRGVEFQLALREEARARGHVDRTQRLAESVYQPWSSFYQQGGEISFRIDIPDNVIPSLTRPHFTLTWVVRARLDVALAPDVSLTAPVTLLPP